MEDAARHPVAEPAEQRGLAGGARGGAGGGDGLPERHPGDATRREVVDLMLEARKLVQECISRGDESAGFKEFIAIAPGLVTLPDKGYRLYIETIFDEIAKGNADLMMTDASETRYQQKLHAGVLCAVHPEKPFDFAGFEAVLIEELVPWIEGRYRTLADRHHRALAGLSMGGMQTYQITLKHLDLFSHIGGFSGAAGFLAADQKLNPKTDYNGAFADPAAFAKKVKLLWLSIGTAEPERMRAGIHRLHNALNEAKIQHVFYESPGTDHEWQTWRRDLHGFAPKLFQK